MSQTFLFKMYLLTIMTHASLTLDFSSEKSKFPNLLSVFSSLCLPFALNFGTNLLVLLLIFFFLIFRCIAPGTELGWDYGYEVKFPTAMQWRSVKSYFRFLIAAQRYLGLLLAFSWLFYNSKNLNCVGLFITTRRGVLEMSFFKSIFLE